MSGFSLIEGDRQSIGGSDWSDIMNVKPFGCQRRAFYRIGGQVPDLPEESNKYMQRGTILEDIVCKLFEEQTGAIVVKRNQEFVGPESYMVINIDGAVHNGKPLYLCEFKTMGQESWEKFQRNGLPQQHIYQVQWYMAISGYDKCKLAVLWPDGWELEIVDILADLKMQELMIAAGRQFWDSIRAVKNIDQLPERLERGSYTCWECPFNVSCWSDIEKEDTASHIVVNDPELENLALDYRNAKDTETFNKKAASHLRDDIIESLKRYGDCVKAGDNFITIRTDKNDKKTLIVEPPK